MDQGKQEHPFKAEYDAAISERLELGPDTHPQGPLIDLRDVAILGGLAKGTPGMARQRTIKGLAGVPFPDPDPDEGRRWEDKPLWRAYVILDYFQKTNNWPLGTAARVKQQRRRLEPKTPSAPEEEKITWTDLRKVDPVLADHIRETKLNDGVRRSPAQWAHRFQYRRAILRRRAAVTGRAARR